jgi:hypothetical protein
MSGRAIIALTRCGIRRHGKTAAGSLGFIAFTTGGARPSMPHTRDNPDARHSSLALTRRIRRGWTRARGCLPWHDIEASSRRARRAREKVTITHQPRVRTERNANLT